ncbi:glycerol-3-phosphate O-acyltransferase [Schizosaccharomyces japonicus yFS275]|uniref:Glycerol-3-phosphate O-acyltransferase n=1 Tax=Schizosaccharomyces japonicus (strain yFS275 / FY16936) TaxID=402676 RepID=B6K3W3_SCHJY|nr:glycerol-3-phosphate O-acyltransferase [Schizosaccharomyces japonicus yFS275]EEB08170.1 glycerol-3-phosphate O-acyltransferase [Schizosaccharomyces japonicus yFS275]
MAFESICKALGQFVYDLALWLVSVLVDLFFREVKSRGSFRVPRKSAVIFVAAPHANQFVDALILMKQIRFACDRRVSTLIAAKSMKVPIVGPIARAFQCIPVARAEDSARSAVGHLRLEDPEKPLYITGTDTKFTQFEPHTLISLPSGGGMAEVKHVIDDTHCVLAKAFRNSKAMDVLTKPEGTPFRTAPKVDQSKMYRAVHDRLNEGNCIAIFPEGGSHDRPELLPLKAGVAIMALGALAENPDLDLKIVPCGMNYFHPHRFRSRAVLEFGDPFTVPRELVELYKNGSRSSAIKQVLDMVYDALVTVTILTPDYTTLEVVQAARRLFKPSEMQLPLPEVVELNRRFVAGYLRYKDNPHVEAVRKQVLRYNEKLYTLGVRDHQVVEPIANAKLHIISLLVFRICLLSSYAMCALPGSILFAPVFIATSYISKRKQATALRNSTVKIEGKDVLASWKLIVGLGFTPFLYIIYGVAAATFTREMGWWGTTSLQFFLLIPVYIYLFTVMTVAALRFGEVGMDIYKTLRPLKLSLHPTKSSVFQNLRKEREILSKRITDLCYTLGPTVYPEMMNHKLAYAYGTNAVSSATDVQASDVSAREVPTPELPELENTGLQKTAASVNHSAVIEAGSSNRCSPALTPVNHGRSPSSSRQTSPTQSSRSSQDGNSEDSADVQSDNALNMNDIHRALQASKRLRKNPRKSTHQS